MPLTKITLPLTVKEDSSVKLIELTMEEPSPKNTVLPEGENLWAIPAELYTGVTVND